MHPINAYGTEEQKQKYLPQLGKQHYIVCETCKINILAQGPKLTFLFWRQLATQCCSQEIRLPAEN